MGVYHEATAAERYYNERNKTKQKHAFLLLLLMPKQCFQ